MISLASCMRLKHQVEAETLLIQLKDSSVHGEVPEPDSFETGVFPQLFNYKLQLAHYLFVASNYLQDLLD